MRRLQSILLDAVANNNGIKPRCLLSELRSVNGAEYTIALLNWTGHAAVKPNLAVVGDGLLLVGQRVIDSDHTRSRNSL
jgi:hypothetical protein